MYKNINFSLTCLIFCNPGTILKIHDSPKENIFFYKYKKYDLEIQIATHTNQDT